MKRFLSLILILTLILGGVPVIQINDGNISLSLTDSLLTMQAAAALDPLTSVAVLNNAPEGAQLADYVTINSAYQLTGYDDQYTTGTKFIAAPANHGTFKTLENGKTENSWGYNYYGDQAWSASGAGIAVTDSANSAQGDYVRSLCGVAAGNANASAKVNALVLQIQAVETVSLSFDYSVSMAFTSGVTNSDTKVQQRAYFYYLITNNAAPTVADLKAGTTVVDGASVNSGKETGFALTIEKGQYLYLYFCGFVCIMEKRVAHYSAEYAFSAAVSNFTVTPATKKYSLTLGTADCANNKIGSGVLTNDGSTDYTIPAAGTIAALTDVSEGTRINLSVKTAPAGYQHIGWRNRTTDEDIYTYEYSFPLTSDMEVYALFVPVVTVTMGSGGYEDAAYSYKMPDGSSRPGADQLVARNSDGSQFYYTLADAFSNTDVVVLLGNIVLNEDFTIPAGKTLSVPYDLEADAATATLITADNTAAVSVYTTATINGTVTLNGYLVASGRQSASANENGRNFGKVGVLTVNGQVNVSSTGQVCAFGIINGTGNIEVASGGSVYELLEVRDLRGFAPLRSTLDTKAFPFNNFFIKNNECTTTYSSGGKLSAYYYVNVQGIKTAGTIPVVGASSSMFNVKSGGLTKSFSAAAPYNNKMIFRAESGSNIQTGSFKITISGPVMRPISINTADYYLPLGYGFALEAADGGSLTINDNYKMLPGALVDVKSGGTMTITNGKNVVFYRANDYDFRPAGGDGQGFGVSGYPVSFTKPSGLSYATNNAANVGSAKLNVDGTLNVQGGLYVTDQLTGNTTYSNGYNTLTGTGMIGITGTLNNGTISEVTQASSANDSTITEGKVPYVPIKGITVYDTTTDDGQTDYNSFTKATWYGYINGSRVNVWSTSKPVTLSYDANGGSGEAPAPARIPEGTKLTVADKQPFTHSGGKEFGGWNTAADGSGTAHTSGETITVTGDTTLYAQWNAVSIVTGENVTKYTTLAKAAADYKGTGYIQMIASTSEPGFELTQDVYLDLNGKTVTLNDTMSGTGKLYGMDSSVTDYTSTPKGKLTCSGETVSTITESSPTGEYYVAIPNEDKSVSFHRYNIYVSGYRFELDRDYKDQDGIEHALGALIFQATLKGNDAVANYMSEYTVNESGEVVAAPFGFTLGTIDLTIDLFGTKDGENSSWNEETKQFEAYWRGYVTKENIVNKHTAQAWVTFQGSNVQGSNVQDDKTKKSDVVELSYLDALLNAADENNTAGINAFLEKMERKERVPVTTGN